MTMRNVVLTQDEALLILRRARSVLDDPCECTGNPPTYEYRKDKRQHCMWCDGLAEVADPADTQQAHPAGP